jgi:hypothetical protein
VIDIGFLPGLILLLALFYSPQTGLGNVFPTSLRGRDGRRLTARLAHRSDRSDRRALGWDMFRAHE